ncbi:beta-lactamase family protein [Roseomonas sp. ACRSG]|nr:beta-lactamase family protein [Roseomonas sp. ACRSG]
MSIAQSETADEDCGNWPRWEAAAEAGWSAPGLEALRQEALNGDTAALMVVTRGRVLHAQGRVATRYNVHSIRKSLLSALIGIHVAEGRIDLEATLDQLGIDDKLGLTAREKLATVLDLLCARSGIYHPSGYESPWMLSIKPARHSVGPGTTWCYNNWDFNALGSIFRQCTGVDIFTDFARRIATPCGMQDFEPARDGQIVELPDSQHPAYPFRMTARDLARFGQMFLEGGQGIVPADWVQISTLPISEAGYRGAYGYMWWVSRAGILFPQVKVPEGSYSALGVGGHFVTVLPALETVVVHRVDTDQKGRAVSIARYGRLLSLLLAAAPR